MGSKRFKSGARGRHSVAAGLVTILALGASLVTVSAAEASSLWSIEPMHHPASQANAQLAGIACTGAASCIAVGWTETHGGTFLALAGRWNGTKWSIRSLDNPAGVRFSQLGSVSCTSATRCTAVGLQQDTSGAYATLVENWNGTKWAVEPSPTPSGGGVTELSSVSCTSAKFCMAVGGVFAERWNGTAWSIVSLPTLAPYGYVNRVACTAPTACIAVGTLGGFGNTFFTLAEKWNGISWTVQTTPNPLGTQGATLDAVACPSTTSCVAVGTYSDGITPLRTLVEAWNGVSWSIVPSPTPIGSGSLLVGVACTSSRACVAVGVGAGAFAESWTGTEWVIVNTRDPAGATTTYLSDVACGSATSCTAVGDYSKPSKQLTLAEHYVG